MNENNNQESQYDVLQKPEEKDSEGFVDTDKSHNENMDARDNKKRNKVVIRIIILLVLLALATWLAVYFLQDRSSERVFSNLNINNQSETVIEGSDIYYQTETSMGDDAVETETTPGRPVTIIEEDYRMSLDVPEQSPVVTPDDIPAESVYIIGTDSGFEPDVFYALPGQEIILALTAQSASPVVLTFIDPNMPAVAIGSGPGETRYVTFEAPTEAGEYIFINNIIGKKDLQGRMIVE